MEERKIGVVPRVFVSGGLGPKEYALFLTDQRMIFVLEKASKAGVGAVLGGVVGAVIADAAAERREYAYAEADPNYLAKDERNMVIAHSSIQKLRVKRQLGGAFHLYIEYASPEGRTKKIGGFLMPPQEQIDRRKANGEKAKAITEDYANKAQQVLKAALPQGVSMNAEWLS